MTLEKYSFSICVLAHNEERSIERTLKNLMNNTYNSDSPITVYANGCTDQTLSIVSTLKKKYQNIKSVEIPIASKVNAWNIAFENEASDIVVFCDGDIIPEKNAINQLIDDLRKNEQIIIASSRLFPICKDGSFGQKIVAFMQLPLSHEYLSGGLYAVKKERLKKKLNQAGFSGIPKGVTGEDYFLERLIDTEELLISRCKNYYMAPEIKDYIRYLARIRWQNEQMSLVLGEHRDTRVSMRKVFMRKILNQKSFLYLFVSVPAVILRYLFKKIFSQKIKEAYRRLGPVVKEGEHILISQTRSHSTK